MSTLDLDLGNTLLKWRVQDSAETSEAIRSCLPEHAHRELQALQGADVERIRLCSVGEHHDGLLRSLDSLWPKVAVAQARVEPHTVGLTCGYEQPEALGVDRWLALLGARTLTARACVVDLGTAITVDYLDNNTHLGGYIAPGLALMRDQLLMRAAKISPANAPQALSELKPGRNTDEALQRGILLAAIGLIENAQTWQSLWPLLLCGGGAQQIAAHRPHWTVQEDLVFRGLQVALP